MNQHDVRLGHGHGHQAVEIVNRPLAVLLIPRRLHGLVPVALKDGHRGVDAVLRGENKREALAARRKLLRGEVADAHANRKRKVVHGAALDGELLHVHAPQHVVGVGDVGVVFRRVLGEEDLAHHVLRHAELARGRALQVEPRHARGLGHKERADVDLLVAVLGRAVGHRAWWGCCESLYRCSGSHGETRAWRLAVRSGLYSQHKFTSPANHLTARRLRPNPTACIHAGARRP